MLFRGFPYNRPTRLVAALVLMAFGAGVFVVLPPLGSLLVTIGFCVVVYQSVQMWRERCDPYDLSRLWEIESVREEPEEDTAEQDLLYCHRCGSSMSQAHSICPHCGTFLGQ